MIVEKKQNRFRGRIWGHKSSYGGRIWLHLWKVCLSAEYKFFKKDFNLAVGITFGGERDILLHLSIPYLFNIFLGVEGAIPHKIKRKIDGYTERVYNLSTFEDVIIFELHYDPNHYEDKKRKGYSKMWSWVDFICGKESVILKTLRSDIIQIKMPEGNYSAAAMVTSRSISRKRFKKKEIIYGLEVTLDSAIFIDRNPKNSWKSNEISYYYMPFTKKMSLVDMINTLEEKILQIRKGNGYVHLEEMI